MKKDKKHLQISRNVHRSWSMVKTPIKLTLVTQTFLPDGRKNGFLSQRHRVHWFSFGKQGVKHSAHPLVYLRHCHTNERYLVNSSLVTGPDS